MTEQPMSLSEAVRVLAAWEREHPHEAAVARAENRAHVLEVEAEQYAHELAEQLWQQRGGIGGGPTDDDRAAADRAALAVLKQALRDPE
ncbi:hypothetical protein ACFWPX_33575 [Nocardia sp. NPDC058518]|uniref:hypothetical protein n=1 Tax=Nocardia sp. NPDC058518 TaxID=3346534 RepID=UPI00364CD058